MIRLFRRLGARFWIRFALACLVAFSLEALFDHYVESETTPGLAQSIFNVYGLYEKIVLAPRNAFPERTSVIEIDPADPGAVSIHDVCRQRAMTATVLRTIAPFLPRVIVIDKYYLNSECDSNAALRDAIRDVSATIPVIVGRRIADESKEPRYLMDALALPQQPGGHLAGAVVNIDRDTRKLPLEWAAFDSASAARQGGALVWQETLALTASRAFEAPAAVTDHHPRLGWLIDHQSHPYVSFIDASQFPCLPVTALTSPGLPSACMGKPIASLEKLSGTVVLLGEINPDLDEHASPIGPMSGLYMQANYIEALLDERYYRAVPVFDYIYGLLFLIGLEMALIVYPGEWLKLAGALVILFAGLLLLLWVTIMLFRCYVNPALVGGIAVLIKIVHSFFAPAEHAAHERARHQRA